MAKMLDAILIGMLIIGVLFILAVAPVRGENLGVNFVLSNSIITDYLPVDFQLLNAPPEIQFVSIDGDVSNDLVVNPVEGSEVLVNVTFRVFDGSGLNDSTAGFELLEESRSGTCCSVTQVGPNLYDYSGNVSMNYYDSNGTKTINVSITDLTDKTSSDSTHYFTYNSLTTLDLGANSLSFGDVSTGTENNPATENSVLVNNTGNRVLNISLTGSNYAGVTNASVSIPANITKLDDDSQIDEGVESGEDHILVTNSSQAFAPSGGLGTLNSTDWYWFVDGPAGYQFQAYQATNWEVTPTVYG